MNVKKGRPAVPKRQVRDIIKRSRKTGNTGGVPQAFQGKGRGALQTRREVAGVEQAEPWQAAVEKLYKEMYLALRVYALRVLEDEPMAEEAVQDAFCIACARREQFLSSSNPQGWIMLTLKHVMQNMLRSQARLNRHLVLDVGEELAAGEPELVSVDLLFGDVSQSEDFQLLKHVALDQCTMPELARELGVSVEACKKRVQRARKRLQGKLRI